MFSQFMNESEIFLKKKQTTKKKTTPKNSSPLDGEAHYKTSQETGH